MRSVETGQLETGRGLLGDRYHAGVGAFSEDLKGTPDVQITLVEIEEIRRFNIERRVQLNPGELRRNLLTRGIRLKDLIGARFSVGDAVLEGIRMCEPCAHLARQVSLRILPDLVHRTGLRAAVVAGGTVRLGDKIVRADGPTDTTGAFERPGPEDFDTTAPRHGD